MNALEPLFPVLRRLEPLGLPPSRLSDWYAVANQRQAARLAELLGQEFTLIGQDYADQIDLVYVRSEAFQANVVQAVRAAEVAESGEKLSLIARALAGCLLAFPSPTVDKFQTMRLIEMISLREARSLSQCFMLLDPIDPYADQLPPQTVFSGLSRQESQAALLGLEQLGLVSRMVDGAYQLTLLARGMALLSRWSVNYDG